MDEKCWELTSRLVGENYSLSLEAERSKGISPVPDQLARYANIADVVVKSTQ